MIKAARFQRRHDPAGPAQPQPRLGRDLTHAIDTDRFWRPGKKPAGTFGGKHDAELEVFAVVESMVERGDAVGPGLVERIGMDRDLVGVQDRSQPSALLEDMPQVGRESVGDVDHGVSRSARRSPAPP